MKIGIVAPLSISLVHGGVRTQAMMTAKELENLGHEIHFITPWDTHFDYDLVHVFSAGPETLGIGMQLTKKGIPFVLSPVFYTNRSSILISSSLLAERILSLAGSGIRSEFGIKADLCKAADLNLPNTYDEARLIRDGFSINDEKISVIPNGVEAHFGEADGTLFTETYGLKDFVLCAAQVSAPRKNIRLLLEAAPDLNADVVIIGEFDSSPYSKHCMELAKKAENVHLIGKLDHQDPMLASAYAACHTFVLPSLYETPGIAALEAALTGAQIVITKNGGTKDYFFDEALYIDPKDRDSLVKSLNTSLTRQKTSTLKERILKRYTWQKVAEKTVTAYQKILS